MRELRYALRVLKNHPGFSAAAVLTLALGIGLNATIFTLFDALALRPIELGGTTPVVSVYQEQRGAQSRNVYGSTNLFSYAEYVAYRDGADVFSGIAAYMPEVTASLGSDPQPMRGQLTSCNYFSVLGATPSLGRGFVPAECAGDDAGPVVVLGDDLWRTHFDADPSILGKQVRLNRVALTVVGVAPKGFHGVEITAPSFWAPVSMQWALAGRSAGDALLSQENTSWLAIAGRLKSGVSIVEARTSLSVIGARLDRAHAGRVTTISVARPSLLGQPDKRRVVVAVGAVFMTAVGLVLLIACANVANLFLARAAGRQREIAVRLALGASRVRLVRQLLIESFVIAVIGGVLGTVAAFWSAIGISRVVAREATSTPLHFAVGFDARIFAYALALVVITTLAFGLAPALQATRPDVNRALKEEDYGASGRRGWLRDSLVGVQVAVCMVLLIAAGLLLRGLNRAETVDPGFSMDGVTVMKVDLRSEGYTAARATAFHHAITERIRALPGVDVVAEGTAAPLGGTHHLTQFNRPGDASGTTLEFAAVTPSYLASVNIPLVRGRDFTPADVADDARLIIVNESAARQFWPGDDPIGKVLHGSRNRDYTVSGVARDAEVADVGKRHTPYLFVVAGSEDALDVSRVIVRGSAPFATIAAAVRAAALSLDPDLHFKVSPLRDNLQPIIQGSRLLATLSSVLGGLALLLATIGIYGTVAFTVARRTREIGIRVALGAHSSTVSTLVVRQSMRPIVAGAVIGTIVCAGVSRVLAPVLFGVSALDVTAFAGVPVFLIAVALTASYLPARRASRVDPMTALRHQ